MKSKVSHDSDVSKSTSEPRRMGCGLVLTSPARRLDLKCSLKPSQCTELEVIILVYMLV